MPVQRVFNFNRLCQPPAPVVVVERVRVSTSLNSTITSGRLDLPFVRSVPPIPCKPSINKDTGKASGTPPLAFPSSPCPPR